MNNVGEKYLPIGTVVMLKGASKRLMITGFCSMPADKKDEVYDYAGCLYPEGFLSSNQTGLFNHEQIERVYHMGLVDEEEKAFKEKLTTVLGKTQSTEKVEEKLGNVEQASVPYMDSPTLQMPTYQAPTIDDTMDYI